jgi:glycosyltransferase involved in cell wall biosynthesis
MTAPVATILIPAWNEAAVIGRTLQAVTRDMPAGLFRIVVIANACTDDTAAVARRAAPDAVVLETPVPGKCHALNLGLSRAVAGAPVVVLDGDLVVGADQILALIAPLRRGAALASCGRMELATQGASALVRAWARVWALNPYFRQGKFGGLFALSPEGAERVFPLPHVTADDEFVRRSFAAGETAFVPGCRFVAQVPRTLAALVRTRRRSVRGTRALGRTRPRGEGAGVLLRAALQRPDLWPDVAVYAAVGVWVRLLLKLERGAAAPRWERDTTTRTPLQP